MKEMLKLIISLSALSIEYSYATTTSCPNGPQSQMAALNERMTQMINALYSSPLLAKSQPSSSSTASTSSPSSSTEYPPSTSSYEAGAFSYPYKVPQVIYVSPAPPSPTIPNPFYTYEPTPLLQPYTYPTASIPLPAPWPYSHDYPHLNYGQPIPSPFPPSQPGYTQPTIHRDYYHPDYPLSLYRPYVPPTPSVYPPVPAPYGPPLQSHAFPPAPAYSTSYAAAPPYPTPYPKLPVTV